MNSSANGFRLLTPSSLPLDVRTSHRLHVEKEDGMEEGKMETYRSLLWSEERRRECGLEDPANSQIIEFTKYGNLLLKSLKMFHS